jgi:hypothetical protein
MEETNVKGWKLPSETWEVARIPSVIFQAPINKYILPQFQCSVGDQLSRRIRLATQLMTYLHQIANFLLDGVRSDE